MDNIKNMANIDFAKSILKELGIKSTTLEKDYGINVREFVDRINSFQNGKKIFSLDNNFKKNIDGKSKIKLEKAIKRQQLIQYASNKLNDSNFSLPKENIVIDNIVKNDNRTFLISVIDLLININRKINKIAKERENSIKKEKDDEKLTVEIDNINNKINELIRNYYGK